MAGLALYAIPVAAAITTYLVQGYGDSAKGIAVHTIADYFETAWTAGFVPALFGVRVPVYGDATFHDVAIVGCQLALIGAVVLSIAGGARPGGHGPCWCSSFS